MPCTQQTVHQSPPEPSSISKPDITDGRSIRQSPPKSTGQGVKTRNRHPTEPGAADPGTRLISRYFRYPAHGFTPFLNWGDGDPSIDSGGPGPPSFLSLATGDHETRSPSRAAGTAST